jgi:hypothetical protein
MARWRRYRNRSLGSLEALLKPGLAREERLRRIAGRPDVDLLSACITLLPIKTYRIVCPPVVTSWGRTRRGEKQVGIAYLISRSKDDPKGRTEACILPFDDRHSGGCSEFPNRSIAKAWLEVKAENMECD